MAKEQINDSGLGTIYVGGAKSGSDRAAAAEKLYARKITHQGKSVDPSKGFILLKDLDGYDVAFVDLQGKDFSVDLTDATVRTYKLVVRGIVPATVKVPASVKISGYNEGSIGEIGVHKDQIVVITLTKTNEGEWFGEVTGETDGHILGIQIKKGGEVFVPTDDGLVTLPIDELAEGLVENLKAFAKEQALYWN
jgi:hypothetical protein